MDSRTAEYYAGNASTVADRYESVDSPFAALFPIVFAPRGRVLDLGCGSGRDMAFLLRHGYDVSGIDGSQALCDQAVRRHPELKGRVECGCFPGGIPDSHSGSFDAVLLSAVLMHIPDAGLFNTAIEIRQTLKIGGTLLVSIPEERDDMSEEPDRDKEGRLMVLRPATQVQLLFERVGFETVATWRSQDTFRREGTGWISLQFTYRGSAGSQSIDRIEAIINRDTKVATYKLALLRALCDISQHENGIVRWDAQGSVAVPISAIADKWIEYYWPLIESDIFVPQIGGETLQSAKPISFREALSDLIISYKGQGKLHGFTADRDARAIPRSSGLLYEAVLSKLKTAIQKPVFYAGGGDSKQKPFEYDPSTKSVLIDGRLWREFTLLGYLIRDSIILRWAEETNRISKEKVEVSTALGLLLTSFAPERDVAAARAVFGINEDLECTWSGRSIRKFDVDHAIPYSLWRDNSLWNLLPVSPSVNNAKRDKLPGLDLLNRRKEAIIYSWETMERAQEVRFRRDAGKILEPARLDWGNWQETLFSGFVEAVETTAVRRGGQRWVG